MTALLKHFQRHISEEHLIAEGQRVLLAVSGGRDSVTLLDLVRRAGIPFAVAHCNFHLRPGDCDRDEAFVRRLAADSGAECHVRQCDTVDYAHSRGLSIEEAAREMRYAFFEELVSQEGYASVATAHHRDDAIETFFINLLRGTGIAGLHGIKSRNGHVIRPLLPFGRADIDAYIEERGLPYVEDSTNAMPLYLRNRIRLELVPLLRQLSPSFDMTMQGNMERFSEIGQIYKLVVDDDRSRILKDASCGPRLMEGAFSLDVEELKRLRPLRSRLFELLRPFGFNSAQSDSVARALDGQSGKQFFSPEYRLVVDRNELLIVPLGTGDEAEQYMVDAGELPFEGPVLIDVEFEAGEEASMSHSGKIRLTPGEAWFDFDEVRFPLTLRHWRDGDRFVPFGMKGSKLVSDLFSDKSLICRPGNRADC